MTVEDEGEWLREALLAFLRNNRSYTETAKELHVHRNTVQYRVRKALEAYGRPLDGDLLGLRLALEAAHWQGPTSSPSDERFPGPPSTDGDMERGKVEGSL